MFHIENEKVRQRLLEGNFGLERESLRVLPDGSFSHTLHPFSEEDKNIVYDFCENQTEINTTVYQSAEDAIEALHGYVKQIQNTLTELPEKELLWPFSNPPYIKNEADIPIARHVDAAGYRDGYREYLADRYGRYKMSLCGIHVNYSFSEELLKADFDLSGETDYQEYKNQVYVALAEKAAAYGWIVTALTAASPVLDGSYFEKGKQGQTTFNGMASTRCSELGYWNYFTPIFDYSDIRNYADSIEQYVGDGLIAASTELYYPIRLKPAGKYSLKRLHDEGVSHIELRMVDLNPFEASGLSLKDLKFIQLMLVWLASTERQSFNMKDQVQAASNFKHAAHYDLKTVKIVIPNGESYSVAEAGKNVIGYMKEFYKDFPEEILEILDYEEAKFIDPENRYAWKIRHQYEENYVEKGLQLAKELQREAVNV